MNACQLRLPQCPVLALSFLNLFKIYYHYFVATPVKNKRTLGYIKDVTDS